MNPAAVPTTSPDTRGPSARSLLMAPKPLRESKRSHVAFRVGLTTVFVDSTKNPSCAPGTSQWHRFEDLAPELRPKTHMGYESELEESVDKPIPKTIKKTKKRKVKKSARNSKTVKKIGQIAPKKAPKTGNNHKKAPKTVVSHKETPRFQHGKIIQHAVKHNLPLRQAVFESRLAQKRDEKMIKLEEYLCGPIEKRRLPQHLLNKFTKVKKKDSVVDNANVRR